MNERCELTSERRSIRPSTLHVDFIVNLIILSTVRRCHTATPKVTPRSHSAVASPSHRRRIAGALRPLTPRVRELAFQRRADAGTAALDARWRAPLQLDGAAALDVRWRALSEWSADLRRRKHVPVSKRECAAAECICAPFNAMFYYFPNEFAKEFYL